MGTISARLRPNLSAIPPHLAGMNLLLLNWKEPKISVYYCMKKLLKDLSFVPSALTR